MISTTPSEDCDVAARELLRFASGDSKGAERKKILEHLLAGCARCRGSLSALRDLNEAESAAEAQAPADETPSISRILASLSDKAAQIEAERAEARRALPDFLGHPPARQWTLIRNSRRYDTWSFCAALLEAAFEAIYDDPRRSRELAEMALEIALRLSPEPYGGRTVLDIQGRAWAHVGNAKRALGDLQGAETSLRKARQLIEDGTGDPLEEAELLYYEASLLRAFRKLDPALRKIRRSVRIYREVGDPHLEGRSRMNEGMIQLLRGNAVATNQCYNDAIRLVDASRDPHLALAAKHNLVWMLLESNEAAAALSRIEEYQDEYRQLDDHLVDLKLSWLKGSILERLEREDEAEEEFVSAIDGFATAELPYEAANASLDLAALYSRQGRVGDVKRIGAETLVLFQSLGVAREAIAAWMVFQKAAETEAVTGALLESLARYYQEARHRPELPFEH